MLLDRREAATCRKRTFNHIYCSFIFALILIIGISLSAKASAQTASFRSVDTNSDGVLSFNELVAAFGEAGARRLIEDIDRNGDNRISIRELRQSSDDKNDDRNGRGGERDDDRDDDEGDDNGDDNDGDDGGDDD